MIYFLQAGPNGHVKIGWTQDERTLKRRRASLQTGQPHKLDLIRTVDAERWAETWFHGFFAGVRSSGEWFRFQEEMMDVMPPDEKPSNHADYGDGEMPQIVIRVPPAMRDKLEAAAKADERPLSQLVRLILSKWLEGRP